MKVPFFDINVQHANIAAEVNAAIQCVGARGDFILGEDVAMFEAEFASYCDAPEAVGVDSGISALELGLRALGIAAGDEIITVAHTFIATASAISFTGARPVFVDVDPKTYTMNPSHIERAITPRTKAILPVHLYGQPADMDRIVAIARRHHLWTIEDACQAHGARFRGRHVGSLADIGCFSFFPAKNLGAFGDAGLLVTRHAEIAQRVRMMRNYGQREKYHHEFLAYNRRLDTVQAAVLRVKLRQLDMWNAARRRAAALYDELLQSVRYLQTPITAAGREHVYHLYVIQHPERDALKAFLEKQGVGTGLHYPVPVHLQQCYQDLNIPAGSFPVTEAIASRVLSLPMYPGIKPAQIRYVCRQIHKFCLVQRSNMRDAVD